MEIFDRRRNILWSDGDVLRAVAEQPRIKFGISDGNVSK